MANRLIIGVSGAQAPALGLALLHAVQSMPETESHLVVATAALVSGLTEDDFAKLADVTYPAADLGAAISSGSFRTAGMVIAPCSLATVAAIASGNSADLVTRAADVCLKERRRLVLVPDESPWGLTDIQNLETITLAGGTILPPVPAFYHQPETTADLLRHTTGKILDQFGLEHDLFARWAGETPMLPAEVVDLLGGDAAGRHPRAHHARAEALVGRLPATRGAVRSAGGDTGGMDARQLLTVLLEPGSFTSWDVPPADVAPGPEYAADLAAARARTGLDESVITGEGRIGGHRVAVAVSEFGFLGGSIGVTAGERLTRAVERATAGRLPLIALPASGGTRMQEGSLAFLQMVKITAAVTAHRAARLPYLVYLRHPTTGGVLASWASLGHLTLAEPGALIGFLGPRVYQALHGAPFPAGVQTAENLAAHGLVDQVLAPGELGDLVDRVLDALAAAPEPAPVAGKTVPAGSAAGDAWESVQRTRGADYPGARDLIAAAATNVVPVRTGSVIVALARVGGFPVVLAAQDRHAPAPGPDALRVARRGLQLAADLGLPLVTVIDTAGGELSAQAEEGGLAGQIAGCLAELLVLPVPTVSVLLGQGTGGAALALLPADRTVAAADAWLAPLAPEGASAIVFRDTGHAAGLARRQGIRAADLAAAGVVDEVITGPGELARNLGRAVHRALAELTGQNPEHRLAARTGRYRRLETMTTVSSPAQPPIGRLVSAPGSVLTCERPDGTREES